MPENYFAAVALNKRQRQTVILKVFRDDLENGVEANDVLELLVCYDAILDAGTIT